MAIFVSGNGTNCENIIRYFKDDEDINTCLVVSNRADAYALQRAAKYGVPCKVLTKQEINDPDTLLPLLAGYGVNFIVLATRCCRCSPVTASTSSCSPASCLWCPVSSPRSSPAAS